MSLGLFFSFLGVAGSGTPGVPPDPPPDPGAVYWWLPMWRTILGQPGPPDGGQTEVVTGSLYWFLPTWRTETTVLTPGTNNLEWGPGNTMTWGGSPLQWG